jgi:uncharacterized protein YjdB
VQLVTHIRHRGLVRHGYRLRTSVGSTAQFDAVVTYTGGTTQDVTSTATWTSSNAAVATVSVSGLVTVVASGTAVISATYSGVAGTDNITVP